MLSLIFLLTPIVGNYKPVDSTPPFLNTAVTYSQVIKSEDCQAKDLRSFDLLDIEGHKVNKFIYLQTKSVLKNARDAGKELELSSTFRDCKEQKILRSANCASSSLPAESCSPPTEKAGESLHNYGMAIDFSCKGYSIFESSPCYKWMQENGSKFKFKQRDREPWHWSLTGK